MLNKNISYNVFRILWIYLLVSTIADLRLHTELDLLPFIHVSELPFIKYIPFVLAAVILIPYQEYKKLISDKFKITVFFILLLFLAAALISSYFAVYQETALKLTARYFFYFVLLLSVSAAAGYYENATDFIIRSFIYINIMIIAGSLLDYYSPDFHNLLVRHFDRPEAKHSVLTIGNTVYMRPMGFITDTNLAAFSIGLALLLLLVNRNRFNQIFVYVFFAAASYVSGLLASRASIIMVLTGAVIFFIIKAADRKAILIFILFFLIFQMFTPQIYTRFVTVSGSTQNEIKFGRLVIWKAALALFKENPVIGAGPGNFFEHSQEKIRAVIFSENPGIDIDNPNSKYHYEVGKGNPHNVFLAILTETGWTGFVIILTLIIYLFYNFFKKRKFIPAVFLVLIIGVSSVSNFAPYYKYYFLICIIFYISAFNEHKIKNNTNL